MTKRSESLRTGGQIGGSARRAGSRPMHRCRILLLALIPVAQVEADAGAVIEVLERFNEYPVSASDEASLRHALRHQLPATGQHAARDVRTEIVLSSRLTVEDRMGGCVWSGPKYRLEMTTTVPNWPDRAQAKPELQEFWDEASGHLREHEAGHRRLAQEAAAELVNQVRDLDTARFRSQPCKKLQKKISAIEARVLMRLDLKHDGYDRRTRNGARGIEQMSATKPSCANLAFRSGAECSAAASPLCPCPSDAGKLLRDP